MAVPRRPRRPTDVLEGLFGSAQALNASEAEFQKLLRARGIYFGDNVLPTFAFAFIAQQAQVDRWAAQAELVIAAAEYQCQTLIEDAMSFDTQALNPDMVELVYNYPGYSRACVICRPDAIPVGDDLMFVELNCDSPAMMMFLDVVAQCLLQLDAFAQWRDSVKPLSSADRLLDTLLACYAEYGGTDHPTIAIADWEGQKTRFEHQRLAEHFEKRGYPTVVCDPRRFRRRNGQLHLDGRVVHLVYRRALAAEIIARYDEIRPFIGAYLDGTICMVNPMRSYVASAKSLLTRILPDELPTELAEAPRYIPRTVMLNRSDMRAAISQQWALWALKRSEGHGGQNVVLPGVGAEGAWREAMQAAAREVWIAQEYIDVPRISLPIVDGDNVAWSEKYFNWNPFVFNGRYAGGLVRFSNSPLINITQGGGLLPTLSI